MHSRAATFRLACLAAGIALGGANWLLARRVIGRRLQVLATRLTDVADTVGTPLGLTVPGPGSPFGVLAHRRP